MLTILYITLGWLVGLSINHAANILPRRETLLQWPACYSCNTPHVGWSALVDWLTNQPVCSHCGHKSDRFVRSVVVEMVTPALFLFLIQRYGFSIQMGIISAYSVILLLVTVTDLEHKLIFNVVMLPAIIFALIMAFFTDITGFWSFATNCNSLLYAIFVFVFSRPTEFWFIAIIGGATGFIISYTAFLAGNLMYGHGALGSGDVTLSVFLGLILGFPYILSTFIMTVFLGAFIPIILLATRRISRKSYIPYGPFLTSSGWFMLIWGNGIWQYFYC